MSLEASTIVLNHSKATGAVKLIMMGIANHINPDNDGAWPSHKKLAGYANCSERYVQDAIAELVKLGELKCASRGGKSRGGNKSNRYWLLLKCPQNCDGTTNHRIIENQNSEDEIQNSMQKIGNSVADIQNPTSYEPYIEPVKESIKEPIKKKTNPLIALPSDWNPNEKTVEMFKTDFAVLDFKIELNKFKSRNESKGQKYKDWDMAFRNWCWTALSYLPEDQRTSKPKPFIFGDFK